jgi:uncharacterized protein RhaS with RHS repeats
LDYFGFRYFSSPQGQFTSPDYPFVDQHAGDPQSWNLYAYARNNPLRYIDPLGLSAEMDEAEQEYACRVGASDCNQSASQKKTDSKSTSVKSTSVKIMLTVKNSADAVGHALEKTSDWMNDNALLIGGATLGMSLLDSPGGMDEVNAVGDEVESKTEGLVADLGRKLDYFFGLATGSEPNVERSLSMKATLEKIGIADTPENRGIMAAYFNRVLNSQNFIDGAKKGFQMIEWPLIGPSGAVKVQTVWDGNRLITGWLKEPK